MRLDLLAMLLNAGLISACGDHAVSPKTQAPAVPTPSRPTGGLAIRGGDPVKSGDYPRVGMVAINSRRTSDNAKRTGTCTGTLVCPNVVMTARHCYAASAGVLIDSTSFKLDSWQTPVPLVDTAYLATAPSPNTDIALSILESPVADVGAYDSKILASAAVPSGTGDLTAVGYGDNGQGQTGVRRTGTMKFAGYVASPPFGTDDKTHPLIKLTQGRADQIACPGDSGGPLYDPDGNITGVAGSIRPNYLAALFRDLTGQSANACSTACVAYYTSVPASRVDIDRLLRSFCVDSSFGCTVSAAQAKVNGAPQPILSAFITATKAVGAGQATVRALKTPGLTQVGTPYQVTIDGSTDPGTGTAYVPLPAGTYTIEVTVYGQDKPRAQAVCRTTATVN
jgi:hypothetical protein